MHRVWGVLGGSVIHLEPIRRDDEDMLVLLDGLRQLGTQESWMAAEGILGRIWPYEGLWYNNASNQGLLHDGQVDQDFEWLLVEVEDALDVNVSRDDELFTNGFVTPCIRHLTDTLADHNHKNGPPYVASKGVYDFPQFDFGKAHGVVHVAGRRVFMKAVDAHVYHEFLLARAEICKRIETEDLGLPPDWNRSML